MGVLFNVNFRHFILKQGILLLNINLDVAKMTTTY
jgi:hypothetical protein